MSRFWVVTGLAATLSACGPGVEPGPREARPPVAARRTGAAFLASTLHPYPEDGSRGLLSVTDRASGRIAAYDSALVALVLARRGERDTAGRILAGLRALQGADGSIPFSFVLPKPDASVPYVRAGAVAWVGYAAAEYLDAERGGTARDAALALARGAADYLLAHQVTAAGDARSGLVRGGAGTLRYAFDARGRPLEIIEPGEVEWTSTEHNVDAFFFFRALARVTGEARYADAARKIAGALPVLWQASQGQLARGVGASGVDAVATLDCASWGAVFLAASGDRDRADTSASVADGRYATRDPRSAVVGHKAQARGPVLESAVLRERLELPARDWSELALVWPEGSAGVALAAWRSGRTARAKEIVDALEPLRDSAGALPTATVDVPFVFDTRPSVAATAWVELLRFELGRDPAKPTLWAP